jgi:hypothetical protein
MKRLKAEYDKKLTSVESQYPAPVNLVSWLYLITVLPRGPVRIISYRSSVTTGGNLN